ncbi:alpha/beta hydrolase [Sporichthya sp.]|uniref:alpha/beta fold hydrolase n=1 Tax=Sporichthya sp. TaxID=65475 RepID=UPI0017D7E0F5|nr:alpha/beta hydrolase [Sporichthya sp.]MBA3745413.1 alpha/beta hydrolase [Sporichthya sp.]
MMPHKRRLAVTEEPTDDPLRIQYTTVHGYRRAFRMAGSGPALLLLHGIGDSSDTWEPVIGELAQHYTVIAPDLLGHGRSDRPRADYSIAAFACGMRDLISVLDFDRVTVVGHSLGGGIAMQFAYQFPERCERLVLVGTGGVGPKTHPMLHLVATPGVETMLPLLRVPGVKQFGSVGLKVLHWLDTDLGRDAEDLVRVFDALPDTPARSAFLRTLRSAVDRRGQVITMLDRCYLSEGMPTLLIWGGRDAIIPVDQARMVNQAMPGSRLEIFDNAGHFPHHTDPERFLAVFREFMDSTEPANYSAAQWRTLLRTGRGMPEPGMTPTAVPDPMEDATIGA